MAGIKQISSIGIKKGLEENLPRGTIENPTGLPDSVFAWTTDRGSLFIGTPQLPAVQSRKPTTANPQGIFPYSNTAILTEWTRNVEELLTYTYRYRDKLSNGQFPGPGSSLEWTYDQASPWDSSNAIISRPLQERLDERVSVKAYGAVGDGIADDTYAIWRAAIDTVKTTTVQQTNGSETVTHTVGHPRALYFPAGKYRITRPILLPGNSTWVGDGPGKTVIFLTRQSEDAFSRCVVETVSAEITLEKLHQYWNAVTAEEQYVVECEHSIGQSNTPLPANIYIRNITFHHAGNTATTPSRDVVRLNRAFHSVWENCEFRGSNISAGKAVQSYHVPQGLTDVRISNQGNGYTTATVTVDPEGAVLRPIIDGGKIVDCQIIDPGWYLLPPTVTITGDGTGAEIIPVTGTEVGRVTPGITGGYNPKTDGIGVFIDGLGTVVDPSYHIFENCIFTELTYGVSMTDQVSQVMFNNCLFSRLYRGISIGEQMWWYSATASMSIPLTGNTPLTVDDLMTLSHGQRVKLLAQTDPVENGIYQVSITGGQYLLTRINTGLHTDGDDYQSALPKKANGPYGIMITDSVFDRIITEAIYVDRGQDILVTGNYMDDTCGRGYGGELWPPTGLAGSPVIYVNGRSHITDNSIARIGGSDIYSRPILYNGLFAHTIKNANVDISTAEHKTVSCIIRPTNPLTSQPITPVQFIDQVMDSGIILPVTELVWDGTAVDEEIREECWEISYSLGVSASPSMPRRIGKLTVLVNVDLLHPENSRCVYRDSESIMDLDTMVQWFPIVRKWPDGNTVVKLYYNNVSGNSYQMTAALRRWNIME